MSRHVRVAAVEGGASPEEVAAITAAITAIAEQHAADAGSGGDPDHLDLWVEASRRSAQRAALRRGPWRLSGRLGRRFRV